MQKKHRFLLLAGLICLWSSCSKDTPPIQAPTQRLDLNTLTFPHSMKGWELYSWSRGAAWKYSILIGTNRLKSYSEVTTNQVIVTGQDSLKMVLDKFPAAELITWFGRGWLTRCWGDASHDLALPPPAILDEIKVYCHLKNLTLQLTD